jgi:hypothetical protein
MNFIHISFSLRIRGTRKILFEGPFLDGLYPLVPVSTGSAKQSFITIKPLSSTWHRRLGHLSSFVVNRILKKNKQYILFF